MYTNKSKSVRMEVLLVSDTFHSKSLSFSLSYIFLSPCWSEGSNFTISWIIPISLLQFVVANIFSYFFACELQNIHFFFFFLFFFLFLFLFWDCQKFSGRSIIRSLESSRGFRCKEVTKESTKIKLQFKLSKVNKSGNTYIVKNHFVKIHKMIQT